MIFRIWAAAIVFTLSFVSARADSIPIWLSGVDPFVHEVMYPENRSDYVDLFQSGAPWKIAARSVGVVKLSTQFISGASDDTLSYVFENLRNRNIDLAVEGLMLTATAKCGIGIEGYSPPKVIEDVVTKIKRLGGELRYIAMDEPLFFGHYSHQANACNASLEDLARDLAERIKAIRKIFPQVEIGDIESIGHSLFSDRVDMIFDWAKAYEAAVGTPLSFLHLDVIWSGPWRQQIEQLKVRLHNAGIKLGIIYNGDPDDPSGLAWTYHAEQRFALVEGNRATMPDQAILQTWMRYPENMLPETQPGTMTWLVNRYTAGRTRLVLDRSGDRLKGELTSADGRPLGGAAIQVSVALSDERGVPMLRTRSGRVPPKAVRALFALRINSECDCSGPADIVIGTARFQDDRSGHEVIKAFPPPAGDKDAALIRFQRQPGQLLMQNTTSFDVTPDNPFTIKVPLHVDVASVGSGYVAVIFLNSQGKEVGRSRLWFGPVGQLVSTVTTDAQGHFTVLLGRDRVRQSLGFRAEFGGDTRNRMASATVGYPGRNSDLDYH